MKLNREILRLAIPSILAGITVPLVGMVDIAVAGHLGGPDTAAAGLDTAAAGLDALTGAAFIGGISVGTMLFDLLYWNFAFIRAGTAGLTAQAYGRKKMAGPAGHDALNGPSAIIIERDGRTPDGAFQSPRTEANDPLSRILGRALRIALLSGLGLIVLQWVVVQLAFLVVRCSPEVQALATRYFYIRIWAAPATLSLFAFKGWFIGLQDSVRPMTADFLVNGLNILLSVALGFGTVLPGGITLLPRMGIGGIALGTVIAQWSGLLYCALAARRRYGFGLIHKHLTLSDLLIFIGAKRTDKNPEDVQRQSLTHQALNRNLILRSVGMIAVYIGFTVLSARLGDLMLAVSTILMKLLMIFSYFTDGFAYAGEALTGRFIGERSADGVRSAVRGTFAWSLGVAAFFILLYWLGGVPLLRLMTSDQSVVEAGRAFLPWLLLMPLIGCPAFAWDGIFIGATASRDLRNSTLLCAAGFFATWFVGMAVAGASVSPETALHILMAAYFVHLAVRTVYLTLRARGALRESLANATS